MIKPFKIFILFFTVIFILIGFILIFPTGQISLGDKITLRFFKVQDIFSPGQKQEKVDVANILNRAMVSDTEELLKAKPTKDADKEEFTGKIETDTNSYLKDLVIDPAHRAFDGQKIEFPGQNYAALENFFQNLDSLRISKDLIRVLHYGDSQLEGDRITSSLRDHFQNNKFFQGCGVGIIPLKEDIHGRKTVIQQSSDNFKALTSLNGSSSLKYGLLSSVYQYISPPSPGLVEKTLNNPPYSNGSKDTLSQNNIRQIVDEKLNQDSVHLASKSKSNSRVPDADSAFSVRDQDRNSEVRAPPPFRNSAWFSLARAQHNGVKSQQVKNIKLLYNNVLQPTEIKISVNEKMFISDILYPTDDFTFSEWDLDRPYNKIKITVTGNKSPDFYGIALDCTTGIAVDNIGLRGASIPGFTAMKVQNLSNMLKSLNAKLVILQFGINVVPNITEDYEYYENMLYKQLSTLKNSDPDISVLVIGVSDMSRKNGTDYESYPNIEKIRNAQKQAAFKAGCAFFDLYEAMGGENSMVSWVQNSPSYAAGDYTHFNDRGANLVGKMLYDALMQEYYGYKNVL